MRADQIEWPAGDTAARVLGASDRKHGPFARMTLGALEVLYGAGVRMRNVAYNRAILRSQRASIPIVSIGNIVAGGAGKTPFTRWVAQQLISHGAKVAVLHGGYGSDEPALHRQWLPGVLVFEERDRVQAVAAAAAAGADVAVLDDAFQHRRLERDLDILLVPAESRSQRMLPAGPLREPLSSIARADVIVVTRKTASASDAARIAEGLHSRYRKPVAVAAILPGVIRPLGTTTDTPPASAIVITAIARPDLLLAHASEYTQVTRMLAYPDHHEFTDSDIKHIVRYAEGRAILTTEKDAVKLRGRIDAQDLWVLEQTVTIEAGAEMLSRSLARLL